MSKSKSSKANKEVEVQKKEEKEKNEVEVKKKEEKNKNEVEEVKDEVKKKEDAKLETTPPETPKKEKKKLFKKKSLLIVILILLPMICCATVMIFSYLATKLDIHNNGNSGGLSGSNGNNQIVEDYDVNGYLGYEEVDVKVEDNTDFHDQLYSFYDNMEKLQIQEELLETAVAGEDVESFFIAYTEYNKIGGEMISQMSAIDLYLNDGEDEGIGFRSIFIKPAYAKERSSLWYYIPVFGSLLKAKHQSIETSRAGMYNYLKNEMPAVDRDQFLVDNNLTSVEDLRTASDSQVEYLAKNTELRVGIDWTKVSTEIGKQAVIATVDGYKIASASNPLKSTGTGSAMRYFTEKGGPVADEIPDAGKRVTVAVPSEVKNVVDQVDKGTDSEWSLLDDSERSALTGAVAGLIQEGDISIIVQKSDANGSGEKFRVPPATYDVVTVTNDTAPLIIPGVEVSKQMVTEVMVPYTGLEIYALDPEISMNLGLQISPVEVEVEITSCADVGGVDSSNEWDTDSCESSYNDCMRFPREYSDEYYDCNSSDGGCWDIGRWEYVTEDNCEIDAENNLNYDNGYFSEDFEYFPDGNLAYCECIVKCREEYSELKDCAGELKSCCEEVVY